MVLSMTGYGRAGALLHGRDIKVELRSVNARFFEYSSRLPRSCAFLEDKLKKLVAAKVSRGKVELSLSIQTVTAADTVVSVNWSLAQGYRAALDSLIEKMDLKNDVTAGMIARFPEVLTQTAAPTNEDELWQDVQSVALQAVDAFVAMRAVEGEKLKADVAGRLDTIEELVAKIEQGSAGRVQAYSDKLYARLQELLGDRSIDESRLVTEAAIFADKTAIDEETVRLHSHVAQYREILALDEPVGRKLDFLTQELNRESNTIGSKCQDVAITRLVVELKSEIEKIREQIQNIE
ncbi:YicC/YloC family endoribonuclease [uncultured Gemmiger sp.]|uniref:YicC/YloC family endoribonuclease n=1 Tax=uncultured Gemmiger sp. TaxID=1623490 RepID=UPI00260076C2|nr:YicC/YloC family endoribonuclease [uncultured Gemmiger sp.]